MVTSQSIQGWEIVCRSARSFEIHHLGKGWALLGLAGPHWASETGFWDLVLHADLSALAASHFLPAVVEALKQLCCRPSRFLNSRRER